MNRIIGKILLVIIMFTIFMCSQVSAADSVGKIFSDAKSFISDDSSGSSDIPVKTENIQNISKVISSILLAISIIVAFITITLMGINFMIQSTEEKAKVKEALIPFCIGAIVSFGAFGIWKIAVTLFVQL